MKLLPASLQAFMLVVKTGTVHGAARELRLTQTAVTRRLHGLELDLGASLFLRSRRGMALTEAGQALLTYCRQATELEGEALARLSGAASVATPRLGLVGPSSLLRSRLVAQVAQALQAHPSVALTVRLDDTGHAAMSLKRGDADFAVLPAKDVVNEFASKRLKPERYVLVVPTAWQQRPLREIVQCERIVDFEPADQMTFQVLEALGLRELAQAERHFVNNTDALCALVEAEAGYSVLSVEFAALPLARGTVVVLGKHAVDISSALAWYPRRHMPPHFRDIVKAIK